MDANTVTPLTPLNIAFNDSGNHVRAVIEEDQVVGILLMRHLLEQVASGHNIHTLAARDVMQTEIISMEQSNNALHAARLFTKHRMKSLVIHDTQGKFLRHINATEAIAALPTSLMGFFMSIQQVMVRHPLTTTADTLLTDVIETWLLHPVSCLIVCNEKHEPIAMLSESDILTWIQHENPSSAHVSDYMQSPLISISHALNLRQTWEIMQEKKVAKIAIADDDGALVGLATATDLLIALCQSQLDTFAQYHCPDDVDMMLEWHKGGLIMAVSDGILARFGLERDEVVGLPWQDGCDTSMVQALLALKRDETLQILWEVDGAALPFVASRDTEQAMMWWRLQ